jgi:hypothetical protein
MQFVFWLILVRFQAICNFIECQQLLEKKTTLHFELQKKDMFWTAVNCKPRQNLQ